MHQLAPTNAKIYELTNKFIYLTKKRLTETKIANQLTDFPPKTRYTNELL